MWKTPFLKKKNSTMCYFYILDFFGRVKLLYTHKIRNSIFMGHLCRLENIRSNCILSAYTYLGIDHVFTSELLQVPKSNFSSR